MVLVIAFFALLLLGIPIALVVLIASTMGIAAYSGTSLQIVTQFLFSGLNNYVLLAIPFFIMSGTIASRGNTSKYLTQVMRMIFGRIKGGSVIAAIAACTFFAAISGSSIATIVAVGSLMMPALIKEAYPESMAIGSITAGGSIGVLIPPSAPMIVLCVAMGTSVGQQFVSGIIPGLLLALAWCLYVYIVSRKHNYGSAEKYTVRESLSILFKAIPALLYPIIVLGGIYSGLTTPTEAAAISVVYVILIELFVYRTTKPKDLIAGLKGSLVSAATMTLIVSAAQVLTWFVTTQQIPVIVTGWITGAVSSKIPFLLLVLLMFFVAGCFMDLVALLLILGPIMSPLLASYGVNPIHFGVICIMAAQISFITPPFGLNLYVSMNLTKKGLVDVAKYTLPYLIILVGVTLLITFCEPISMFLPNLMKPV